MILVRVLAPHFCAGMVIENDRVIEAAPIIKYMVGWTSERARAYIRGKGWTATKRKVA